MEIKYIFQAKSTCKIFLAGVALCLSGIGIQAQTQDSVAVIEDGWIKKMDDNIAMDISLNNAKEIFEVRSPNQNIIIHPNADINLRYSLNYKFISLGFQMAPDFIPGNGDEDSKGDTKSFSLGTTLILKHSFFELSYVKVKGFYLDNTDDFMARLPGDPYIQFPDLRYKAFSISSGYYNNSRFSFKSLTSQTERQLKSAGSFIPMFNLRYYIVDDQSSISDTQKSNNWEASIGPGYAYTFVAQEKFYASVGAQANLGYLNTKLTTRQPTGDVISNQDNFLFRWDGKVGVGYNGNTFYTGLYTTLSGTQYKQEGTTVRNFDTRVYHHLFLGIRIKAPDYLKRKVSQFEQRFL
ncbi:DUF4421 family protein [Maribacter sp. CXY002]|uniref:DUF4421 family protein n=1 Tax=Maribacter luteocoastalis TaxID=3407671 RepID=UPI003B684E54